MIVALIILAALVAVGLSLWLLHRRDTADDVQSPPPPPPEPLPKTEESAPAPDIEIDSDACCGMHITCEKDSLLASVSREVEYFDDEEPDRLAGRGAEDYSPEEIEEFRDVLLTLLPTDIAPWARSIQLRGITLPSEVREELLMIVAEARKGDDH